MTVLKRDIVRMWNDLWNTFPQNVASLPQSTIYFLFKKFSDFYKSRLMQPGARSVHAVQLA